MKKETQIQDVDDEPTCVFVCQKHKYLKNTTKNKIKFLFFGFDSSCETGTNFEFTGWVK